MAIKNVWGWGGGGGGKGSPVLRALAEGGKTIHTE